MPRTRGRWKTFYIMASADFRSLQSGWQSFPHDKHTAVFTGSGGAGIMETNLPIIELRSLFRTAGVGWMQYVSDTKPSWEGEGADEINATDGEKKENL